MNAKNESIRSIAMSPAGTSNSDQSNKDKIKPKAPQRNRKRGKKSNSSEQMNDVPPKKIIVIEAKESDINSELIKEGISINKKQIVIVRKISGEANEKSDTGQTAAGDKISIQTEIKNILKASGESQSIIKVNNKSVTKNNKSFKNIQVKESSTSRRVIKETSKDLNLGNESSRVILSNEEDHDLKDNPGKTWPCKGRNMPNLNKMPIKNANDEMKSYIENKNLKEMPVMSFNGKIKSQNLQYSTAQKISNTSSDNTKSKEKRNFSVVSTMVVKDKGNDKTAPETDTKATSENRQNDYFDDADGRQISLRKSRSNASVCTDDERSLTSLLDFYADDVKRHIEGQNEIEESVKMKSPPSLEDSRLEFSEAEDHDEICEHCNEKFVSVFDMAQHKCHKKSEFKSPTDFSEFNKTLRKRDLHTPDPIKVKECEKKAETKPVEVKGGYKPRCGYSFHKFPAPGIIRSDQKKYGRGKDEGPFECHICKKVILRRSNLKIHIRRHTGEMPFQCEYCSKKFVAQYDLDRHCAQHLISQKLAYRFMCEVCQRPFVSKDGLFQHMKIVHPKQAKYTCNICKMTFYEEFKHAKHMAEHDTTVIEESLELLESMETEQSLPTHETKAPEIIPQVISQSAVSVPMPPLIILKGPNPSSPLIIATKSQLISNNRTTVEGKPKMVISVPQLTNIEKQTVTHNIAPENVDIDNETLGDVDLNELDVETASEVDLNEIEVLDLEDKSSQDSIENPLFSNNNTIASNPPELTSPIMNYNESIQESSNGIQLEHFQFQTNAENGCDEYNLDYLAENSNSSTTANFFTHPKTFHFSDLRGNQEMLELVDMMESESLETFSHPSEDVIKTNQILQSLRMDKSNSGMSELDIGNNDSNINYPSHESLNMIEPMDMLISKEDNRTMESIGADFHDCTKDIATGTNVRGHDNNLSTGINVSEPTTAKVTSQLVKPAPNTVNSGLPISQIKTMSQKNISNPTLPLQVILKKPSILNGSIEVVNINQVAEGKPNNVSNIILLYK